MSSAENYEFTNDHYLTIQISTDVSEVNDLKAIFRTPWSLSPDNDLIRLHKLFRCVYKAGYQLIQ